MKRNDLFFPLLKRRGKYFGKGKGRKPQYGDFQAEIEEDCQKRCVYCDIQLSEHGYEGMQLDHFRPQIRFPDLKDDPTNLLLACPKCNRLKWHHWPGDHASKEHSHSGSIGFVDPFEVDRLDYFEVKATGELTPRMPPAAYMLDLLKLNRKARTQIRRLRQFRREMESFATKLTDELDTVVCQWRSDRLSPEEGMRRVEQIRKQLGALEEARQAIAREVEFA